MNRINRKSGLNLTPNVFAQLHKDLIKALKTEYKVNPDTLMDYQLYGFNYFDENLPSIKKLISERTGKWVNGKYLYNKYREWRNGVNPIKFTREFVFIYFQTLGYSDINDFLRQSALPSTELNAQLGLEIKESDLSEEEYYVGYFEGEEGSIIFNKLTLSERNLKVKFAMAYWETTEDYSEYVYQGAVSYQENGMSFYFSNESNDLDRSLFIAIFCERRIKIKPFLVGAVAGYNRDRQPVSLEIIFQRVGSKEEQEEFIKHKKLDPIIAQYLGGKRWTVLGTMPQSLYDLSVNSKFATSINNYIKSYRGVFVTLEHGVFILELTIKDSSGNATLSIAGHPLYQGTIKIQASGQILIGRFHNTATPTPLFLSIQVMPIGNGWHKGDLLGVSRYDQSFSGKIYCANHAISKASLPGYRGNELTLSEIKSLPSEILNDLNIIFNNNQIKTLFKTDNTSLQNNYINYWAGTYTLSYTDDAQQNNKAILSIQENGQTQLTNPPHTYIGHAMICEGSVLSIYFTSCNGIPHCGQIMGRIGRKRKEDLDAFSASWQYLDEGFQTKARTVTLLRE